MLLGFVKGRLGILFLCLVHLKSVHLRLCLLSELLDLQYQLGLKLVKVGALSSNILSCSRKVQSWWLFLCWPRMKRRRWLKCTLHAMRVKEESRVYFSCCHCCIMILVDIYWYHALMSYGVNNVLSWVENRTWFGCAKVGFEETVKVPCRIVLLISIQEGCFLQLDPFYFYWFIHQPRMERLGCSLAIENHWLHLGKILGFTFINLSWCFG